MNLDAAEKQQARPGRGGGLGDARGKLDIHRTQLCARDTVGMSDRGEVDHGVFRLESRQLGSAAQIERGVRAPGTGKRGAQRLADETGRTADIDHASRIER